MFWSSPTPSSTDGVSAGLEAMLPLLTESQQELAKLLCSKEMGQGHLFKDWPATDEGNDVSPAIKRRFVEQLEKLNEAYPTGLIGYIKNARTLLDSSRRGLNPLQGWSPSVPKGMSLELGTEEYDKMETIGRHELGSVGFVLVAGGLGERLGYGDIKVRVMCVCLCVCEQCVFVDSSSCPCRHCHCVYSTEATRHVLFLVHGHANPPSRVLFIHSVHSIDPFSTIVNTCGSDLVV